MPLQHMEINTNLNAPVSVSNDLWTGIKVQEFLLTKGALPENEMSNHHLTVNIGTTGFAHHKVRGAWNTVQYDFGAVGFIPANQVNEPRWNFNSRILTIDVQDDPAYRSNYVARHGLVDRDVAGIALTLSKELKYGEGASKLLGDVCAVALKSLLADRYNTSVFKKRTVYAGLSGAQLAAIVDYCKSNLSQNISLNELASLCHLSPFHFLRQFKKSCGLAPHQFFNEIKVDEAKNKLVSSDIAMKELCFELGFSDQAHFSRIFKQHTGLSPRTYRSSMKTSKIYL